MHYANPSAHRGFAAFLPVTFVLLFAVPAKAQFDGPVDLTSPRGNFLDAESADFNGDGFDDIVASNSDGFNAPGLLLYLNDGPGGFLPEAPIGGLLEDYVFDLELADLNGDANTDILVAGSDRVGYLLGNGTGGFGPEMLLTDTLVGTRKATPVDLDGDGDTDVLSIYDEPGIFDNFSGVVWYEQGPVGVWTAHPIYEGTAVQDPYDIEAGDLDGDGNTDLMLANLNGDKVVWFPGLGGTSFSAPVVIPTTLVGCRDLHPADLDGDGDTDLAINGVGDFRIAWLRNDGGAASFTQIRLSVINSSVDDCQDLEVFDADGDGDLDIAGALIDENAVDYVRNNGGGSFTAPVRLQGAAYRCYAVSSGDYDGDGDLDLASGSQLDSKLAWYENLGLGSGAFGKDQPISRSAGGIGNTAPTDLDGDGDLDLVYTTGLDQDLGWIENTGSGFASRQILFTDMVGLAEVESADLDGDGDADLAVIGDTSVRVYLNNGGLNFTAIDLSGTHDDCRDLEIADLDGNGTPDLVVTSWFDSQLSWYANLGGGSFGPRQSIGNVGGADGLAVADFDNDGDMDIAASEEFNDWIVYYENLGGGSFGPETAITLSTLNGIFGLDAADLNGDGFPDIVYSAFYANRVGYVPSDGSGGFNTRIDFPGAVFGPWVPSTSDVNGDGELDVLVPLYSENRSIVYLNQGGGVFGPRPELFSAFEYHRFIQPFDADGDGDEDLAIGFKNTLTYLENLRLEPTCSSASAPTSLSSVVSSNVLLSWNPIPGSVACQVRGRQLPGTSYATAAPVLGSPPSSISIPRGALTPGADYAWIVRCACSISPVDATPFSVEDTFSTPLARTADAAASANSGTIVPNPASHWATVPGAAPDATLMLYDATGRLRQQAPAGQNSLDVSGLPAGLYRVSALAPSGEHQDHGWLRVSRTGAPE